MSILAILDQRASYGYQLRSEFQRRTGSAWPINAGQIYHTIERLEREGLIRQFSQHDQDGSQRYYEITEQGHLAVTQWLASPVVRDASGRDELAMKLAVAVTLPGVSIRTVIQTQRSATLATLQDLTRAKNAGSNPESPEELAWLLVVDSMIFAAEAEVRWLDHSETRLTRAAEAGLTLEVPVSGERPPRGRPAKTVSRA